MPKASDLIGLSVLVEPELRRIGRVHEIVLSPDRCQIRGLVIDAGGLFRPRRVLDFAAVRAVGATHLIARAEQFVPDDLPHCRAEALQGLPVLDGAGEELGTMDDLHYDLATGQIEALQLSRGFVDDLLGGKEIVPLGGAMVAGEAAILVEGLEGSGGELK